MVAAIQLSQSPPHSVRSYPGIPGSKTVEAAKIAFATLSEHLDALKDVKRLPGSSEETDDSNLIAEISHKHWTEDAAPLEERDRVEKPDPNAIIRLCYLATFSETNGEQKVPFTKEDLEAFVLSKTTRDTTYRGFKLSMIPFTVLSGVQGFAALMIPNTIWAQALLITASGVAIAAAGVLYTGYNPDHSQDCLNDKVDKLNRVTEELNEVARTLISFCFYKEASTRKLAQQAAQEINIEWIEKAATASPQYAITKQDIEHSLKLLKQATDYINKQQRPTDNELRTLLQRCLERKDELIIQGRWEIA